MDDIRIAIYIRLSVADEETGHGKDESNSVVNQRGLIHHYLDRHPELSRYPRTEFVDDGFTGTNTDRPAYQRMMDEIKAGRFNVCISKDFSRLNRDYIELGDTVEYLFPFLRVRYISINDGYDSKDYDGTTGGLDVVMRAIVYDAYSKDLSIKARTGHLQNMKKGRRTAGLPPYGYMRDPKNRGMDLIDPETAPIVRRIFDEAISGKGISDIARGLTEDGIATPSEYHKSKNPKSGKYGGISDKIHWNYTSVHSILKNFKYTGASVGGKRKQVAPCKKQSVAVDPGEYIIVPDMHEAIVSVEEFQKAGEVIGECRNKDNRATHVYPLKSLVICGNCGHRMQRSAPGRSFLCSYWRTDRNNGCREVRSPLEKDLEEIVFEAIRQYVTMADKKRKSAKQFQTKRKSVIHTEVQTISDLQAEMEKLKKEKLKAYEKYASGKMSKDDYLRNKSSIDEKIIALEDKISSSENKVSDLEQMSLEVSSELEAASTAFQNETELTYDMAHAFVDRIVISIDGSIEIKWRFKDIFADEAAE